MHRNSVRTSFPPIITSETKVSDVLVLHKRPSFATYPKLPLINVSLPRVSAWVWVLRALVLVSADVHTRKGNLHRLFNAFGSIWFVWLFTRIVKQKERGNIVERKYEGSTVRSPVSFMFCVIDCRVRCDAYIYIYFV